MKLFPLAFAILFGTVIAQLRLHHIQTTGTHNSYHIAPTPATVHWNYTRLDLAVQLSTQGIRRVELDILPNGTEFRVLHFTTYDEVSNCRNLTECTTKLRNWSLANPGHGPVFVMIGPKLNSMSAGTWQNYENILNSVFSPGHILTPDMVRGANANLRDQIVSVGWPLFNDTRGKFIFYISGGYSNYNSGAYAGSKGRTSFVSYGPTQTSISDCAIILMDHPSIANISTIISQHFLVSTRADGDYFPGAENLPASAINAQYFAVADRDHNNALTMTEVSSFTAALGINLSQSQLNTLISICASGQTTFDETQWNCAMNTISGLGYNAIPTSPSFAEVTSQRNAAYSSGAHIIDTDYPLPPFPGASQSNYYWASTPGGNYYRCNPITTQGMSCSDADFELNPENTSTGQSGTSTASSSSSGQATGSGTSTGSSASSGTVTGSDGNTTDGQEGSSSSTKVNLVLVVISLLVYLL